MACGINSVLAGCSNVNAVEFNWLWLKLSGCYTIAISSLWNRERVLLSHRQVNHASLLVFAFWPTAAFAAETESSSLWFIVFLVASFLLAGTLYLLSALVFVLCAKEGQFNKTVVHGVPSAVMGLSILGFAVTGFAVMVTISAALVGWALAFMSHHWALKKWLSRGA